MVTKFSPELNKVYFINHYSLFQVLSGSGSIEVDFKNYFDWQDKIIYLNKGQYIKFLSDDFVVRKIIFDDKIVFDNKEFRVLFKHLVSLGYINFPECEDCQKYLDQTVFSTTLTDIIDISSKQWFWQNPFNARKEEYHLIFDVKDIVDSDYKNHLSNSDLTALLQENGHKAQSLVKDKVGLSVRHLFADKRLLESKKDIAFTDKSIKEIAYDLGFKDPAYFNRIFSQSMGKSPMDFRKDYDFHNGDLFTQDLIDLLHTYHTTERSLAFYAEKMQLSVKSLSKKVRDKMQVSLGQLIRHEIIQTAKMMLIKGESIHAIAYHLGFAEANHFSSFFKHYAGLTPTAFKEKKSRM